MSKLILLFSIFISFHSFGQVNFCTNELETFPTRSGGRIKPFYVLATDTIKFISGESKVGELSATEAFCKLSLKAFGMPTEIPVQVRVDHVDAKKLLGMNIDDHSMPIATALTKIGDIETEIAQLKENNSYKKELTKVKQRIEAYRAIVDARLWTIPVVSGENVEFVSLGQFLTEQKVTEAREKSDNPVNYLFENAKAEYLKVAGDDYLLELKYFKWNLYMWAMIGAILGIFLIVSLKNK